MALRLPGLQGMRSDCPAKRRASRSNPPVALRLPGLQGVGRVARLSVVPAGAIPRWRCAYRGYRASVGLPG
ncbi:hypothetical protein [Raoultella ornithinolytica]|uniref:hypothetical protein n=1 Tax=Raoultella ornithinolytica TaxID=54291 RepID=UPI003F50C24F